GGFAGGITPCGTEFNRAILTVKKAGKNGAYQHDQQQRTDHRSFGDSQSPGPEDGRSRGICRRKEPDDSSPRARGGESLLEVCWRLSSLLQRPRDQCLGSRSAGRGRQRITYENGN